MKEKNPKVRKTVTAKRKQKDEWLESKTHFTTIKGESGHENTKPKQTDDDDVTRKFVGFRL